MGPEYGVASSYGGRLRSGLVLVNESSGSGAASTDEVRRHFEGFEVEVFDGDTVAERVRAAIESGVDFVGVAGGDGTVRCVAELLVDTDVPLVTIPAGTRNHFARELEIEDVEHAAAAVRGTDGVRRAVDVGDVNGRVFLNNSSIGLYPALVVERERREDRLPKALANISAAWQQLWKGHRVTVTVEGRRLAVWNVFVGNGQYGEELATLLTRESLPANVLDVRVVRADRRFARGRVFLALLLGRLSRSPLVLAMTPTDAVVDVRHASARVALDGEVEVLDAPLHFRSRPKALTVLVPPPSPAEP
jgi:diacylglycerol kinase family enzyme